MFWRKYIRLWVFEDSRERRRQLGNYAKEKTSQKGDRHQKNGGKGKGLWFPKEQNE